jgi:hypothetical protein
MNRVVHCVRLLSARLACAILMLGSAASASSAQSTGPYFDAGSQPRPQYELRVRVAYNHASRHDFAAPVFLFANRPRVIDAHELRTEFDLRIGLTPALAIQAVVPVSYRVVDVTLDGLLVNADAQLASPKLTLTGFGVCDPTLTLAYRFVHAAEVSAYGEFGTRVPIDDNPGSSTLPRRIPLGTGQNLLTFGLGGNGQSGALAVSFAYHFDFSLGNAATYLVRRTDNQSYTSGSLSGTLDHRITARLRYALSEIFSLAVEPEFRVIEQPELVDRNTTFAFTKDDVRYDLSAELSLALQLYAGHTLSLAYRNAFAKSWDDDPFFPIAIPARGVSLLWQVTAQ